MQQHCATAQNHFFSDLLQPSIMVIIKLMICHFVSYVLKRECIMHNETSNSTQSNLIQPSHINLFFFFLFVFSFSVLFPFCCFHTHIYKFLLLVSHWRWMEYSLVFSASKHRWSSHFRSYFLKQALLIF